MASPSIPPKRSVWWSYTDLFADLLTGIMFLVVLFTQAQQLSSLNFTILVGCVVAMAIGRSVSHWMAVKIAVLSEPEAHGRLRHAAILSTVFSGIILLAVVVVLMKRLAP